MSEELTEIIERQQSYGPFVVHGFREGGGLSENPLHAVGDVLHILESGLEGVPDPVVSKALLMNMLDGIRRELGLRVQP